MIETNALISSLRSGVCPACGGAKKSAQTMCRSCYFKLPRMMRDALYDRVGAGYEQAFDEAMQRLGVTEPHIPTEARHDHR